MIIPVILAGGKGTRMGEQSATVNKPLIEVFGTPIVLHVGYRFFQSGFKKIYIAAGWQFDRFQSKLLAQMEKAEGHPILAEMIKHCHFEVLDTGKEADTAERVSQIPATAADTFFITYGDTITNLNCNEAIKIYEKARQFDSPISQTCVTQPENSFGVLDVDMEDMKVISFNEKQPRLPVWVGCGFHLIPVSSFRENSDTSLERETLPRLARQKKLNFYCHHGLWHPLDKMADLMALEDRYHKAQKSLPWL